MNEGKILAKKLISRLKDDELCIFLFHGVIKENINPIRNYTGKHLEEEIFFNCLKELKKVGNAISMDEVLFHHEQKLNFPPFSFSITFDDGFENNLSIAAPIMREFSIPSMIYLTTDFIDKNTMSWIDKIEYAVENTCKKNILDPILNSFIDIDSKKEKIEFLGRIRKFVKSSININPNEFAEKVCIKLDININNLPNHGPLDKKITWKQIKDARNNKLLSFGGHSHSHSILSYLSKESLAIELDTSLKLLKEKADLDTIHYSYPEGLENCYSQEVIEQLIERGIKCCPTAIDGTNNHVTNPFHYRRIFV